MLSPESCRVVAGKNSTIYTRGSSLSPKVSDVVALHKELSAKLSYYKKEAKCTGTFSSPTDNGGEHNTPLSTQLLSTPNKIHSGGSSNISTGSQDSSKVQLPLDRNTPVSSFLLPTAPPPSPGDYLETSELPLDPSQLHQQQSQPPLHSQLLLCPHVMKPPPIIVTPAPEDEKVSSHGKECSSASDKPVSIEEEAAISSYLHISVIVMFLCLFVNPFGVICGIAALLSSCLSKHYNKQGRYNLANSYSRCAFILNISSIVTGIGIISIVIPVVVVVATNTN
ncbi:PREDICTED: uncharacterized protein LOC109582287 isoform X1 [Amphimedon queenslandica]|uniref:Uncharacterized protein n=1 Tax=Amphimedon queenslandica TaxID=400682 RepID=A0A1X7UTQ4_AMPQE|nr:PREDICTED: uncharacterized protein LOC109582287 isoform X1 [Amphimedon queenslandica]|eukprot:XP_019852516.1 PREDICTED: uncharacterized protein LOC109582287 isoform X1 [Amphimedon queenslandica]